MNNVTTTTTIVAQYADGRITGTEMTAALLASQAKLVELYADGIITCAEMTNRIVAAQAEFAAAIAR